MDVLSLFDGISCGQVALERCGFDVEQYYSSEIDKNAIKVTQANYPYTIQLGDITEITFPPKVDLVMGGSPCQGFSFVGNRLNFDDPRSKLFFEFVRVLKLVDPKYFLFENVVMAKRSQDVISEHLGVEPILIDSKLVSAQSRKRLYWTNIPNVTQPEDKMIYLIDVTEDLGCCLPAASRARYINGVSGKTEQRIEQRKDGKANAMTTVKKNCMIMNLFGEVRYPYRWEAERLQTMPEGYTDCVSEHVAFKLLGNGWTVDVISHILSGMDFGG